MKNLDKTSLDIIPTSKQFRGTVNSSKKSDSNKYDVFKPNKKVSESQFQESEDKIDYEISHKGEALLM